MFTGFQFDYVFDWTILKYQQSQLANPPTRGIVSVHGAIYFCWSLLLNRFEFFLFLLGPYVGNSSGMPPIVSADRQIGSLF
jgi:casein kinase 1